jgi:hypothetical protein
MSEIIFTDDSIGCVFDGTQGWHNTYRLIDLAVSHGMELDAFEREEALEAYRASGYGEISDQHLDTVVESGGLSDRALGHLQALTAPGLFWVWDDGLYITPGCQDGEEPLSPADCEHCQRGQFS